ncbi:hypothetical protein NBRC10512v2_004791 [Rhodotorula toruloides]
MSSDLNYARFCSLLDSTDPPLVRRKSSKWKVLSQNWWDSLRDESRQELDQWALAVNAWHRNFHGLPAAEEAEAVKQDEVLDVFRAISQHQKRCHAWQAMKQQSSPNSGGFLGDGLRQTLRKKLSGISLRRSSSPPLDSQYRAIGHRAARWYGTSKEAWDAGEAF